MAVKTFDNSQDVLSYLQSRYGSADYKNWQKLRRQFYSYVPYLEAGAASFTFFADAVGTNSTTPQLTNMPKAGSFGQNHFLLRAIRCKTYIQTWNLLNWAGADNDTLVSDILNGFVHAGVLTLNINQRQYAQIPKPFLYAPPADGRANIHPAGLVSIAVSASVISELTWHTPFASLDSRVDGLYLVDPAILIEAEQNFNVTIDFPSGAVGVIGTDITNDTSNPLYIGVSLDGELYRPLQ